MEFPEAARNFILEEASRVPLSKLEAAAQGLSERYRGERTGKRLVTAPMDVLAYSAVRMPATYGAVSAALRLSGLENIRTMLDVGAGTGAASLAAGQYFPLKALFCLERETAMRDMGKRLLAASGCFEGATVQWQPFELGASRLTLHGDLVVGAYLLNELPERSLDEAVEALYLAADKALLLVEPGTPEGFRTLLRVRRRLVKLGAHIAAPCPHQKECPLIREQDWCAFTCRVSRDKLHLRLKGGDVPYEDEKFCFLTVTKEPAKPVSARILRHPQIAPGRVQLTLCTEQGIESRTVSKKDGALFRLARKAASGDAFEEKITTSEEEI